MKNNVEKENILEIKRTLVVFEGSLNLLYNIAKSRGVLSLVRNARFGCYKIPKV